MPQEHDQHSISQSPDPSGFDAVLDIPVTLQVNLGHAELSISELLSLNIGTVIELNNEVGAPIELYVNNRLIAKGEVILVDEKLGISILEADTSQAF